MEDTRIGQVRREGPWAGDLCRLNSCQRRAGGRGLCSPIPQTLNLSVG